ncbi:MAG: dihydrofolate reductase [Thermodesulfobacteriota bacterium]
MEITLICAMAANRVIGRNNRIPWHLPKELAFFKKVTMGHPIIMGRRTYESIGRPLPGRRNIVLSRGSSSFSGCEKVSSLEEALDDCRYSDKVFLIGGAGVYELGLSYCDTIILTILDRTVEGDTFFPEFDHLPFEEFSRTRTEGEENYTTIVYRRIR